jgi:hypothetical protein
MLQLLRFQHEARASTAAFWASEGAAITLANVAARKQRLIFILSVGEKK